MMHIKDELKNIRILNISLLNLVIGLVLVGAIVAVNRYKGELLGPIKSNVNSESTLEWRISEHDTGDAFLINSLTDSTQVPNYPPEQWVGHLQIDSNGDVAKLFRIQAQLEFHKN